ncbi:cytochrome P450 [Streptomyces sp. NPDC048297]|uniref:cytochrome P450 n=1 Tax=Streptomyces sp. NPDC048297 TaxID=3365531 RepID=UPI003721F20A
MTTAPRIFSMEYYSDPFPTLKQMREHEPVARVSPPFADIDLWLVSRYDDIRNLATDRRLTVDAKVASERFRRSGLAMGVGTNWEKAFVVNQRDNVRQRKLIGATHTPRMTAGWTPMISEIASALLDRMPTDMVGEYGYPLASTTIATVLGIRESDHELMRGWADAATGADRAASTQALRDTLDYIGEQIKVKRKQPADDLLTLLINASDGDDRLDDEEIAAIAGNLFIAGTDTTANFFANAVAALLDHPDQLDLLRADPALMDQAVDEVLRYSNPVILSPGFRHALEPIELHGTVIPEGGTVGFLLAAANRDPRVYDEPDALRITRTDAPHLGFGYGPNHCVGSALARLECKIGLASLLDRHPRLDLGVDRTELTHRISPFMYGFNRLPLATHSATPTTSTAAETTSTSPAEVLA